jgi:hypothetical protein
VREPRFRGDSSTTSPTPLGTGRPSRQLPILSRPDHTASRSRKRGLQWTQYCGSLLALSLLLLVRCGESRLAGSPQEAHTRRGLESDPSHRGQSSSSYRKHFAQSVAACTLRAVVTGTLSVSGASGCLAWQPALAFFYVFSTLTVYLCVAQISTFNLLYLHTASSLFVPNLRITAVLAM